jgi:cytochrome c oxidase assembly protein subunit 15
MSFDDRPLDPTSDPGRYRPGPHRAAWLAAAFTLPLLFLGGTVTSFGVGLAVPDWPTTFGINMFLYNFWNDSFGVKVEHSHRLYGAAVGLATIALALMLFARERRRYVKWLGVVTLMAVVAQGVMGGLRVNQISTTLAAIHGCFGQAFFGLMVALAVLTGRVWHDAGPARPDPAGLRAWAFVALAMVYAQIVAGAWFRHFKTPVALWSHAALAVVVLGVSHATAARVRRHRTEARALWPSALALAVTATLQVGLGLLALWLMLPLGGNPRTPTLWQAMTRTAHQTDGALLLAATVVLALRAVRHLGPDAETEPVSKTDPAPRALEALA